MTQGRDTPTPGPGPVSPMPCEEIQAHLFDYFTREMGEGRSDLIREHLRRCPACQARAAEMREAVALLRQGDRGDAPDHLSARHRARLDWALAHPVLDWIYYHHVAVSVVAAVLAVLTAFGLLRHYQVLRRPDPGPAIEVRIGYPPSATNTPGTGPP